MLLVHGLARYLTSVVAVVGLTTTTLARLGLRSPVSHTAELVALRERSVGNTAQHVVGGGRGAPGVARGEGRHKVSDRDGGHDEGSGNIQRKTRTEEERENEENPAKEGWMAVVGGKNWLDGDYRRFPNDAIFVSRALVRRCLVTATSVSHC